MGWCRIYSAGLVWSGDEMGHHGPASGTKVARCVTGVVLAVAWLESRSMRARARFGSRCLIEYGCRGGGVLVLLLMLWDTMGFVSRCCSHVMYL